MVFYRKICALTGILKKHSKKESFISLMNEIKKYTEKVFEDIKHIDENGNEYWLARELMPLLEYSKWERFSNTIENAKIACKKNF